MGAMRFLGAFGRHTPSGPLSLLMSVLALHLIAWGGAALAQWAWATPGGMRATEVKFARRIPTPVRAELVEALSGATPTLRHGVFDKLSPLLRANGCFMHRESRDARWSD